MHRIQLTPLPLTDLSSLSFGGCILIPVAYGMVLRYRRTVVFGFSALNMFMVASATLSGFFFGTLFDRLPGSFTDEHLDVVSYSVAGLLAMVAGIYLGSRPRERSARSFRRGDGYTQKADHINQEIGWLTFCVGATAELALIIVHSVPTVSTAFNCLSALERVGLCILLVTAIENGRWVRFFAAFTVFCFLSILFSLAGGYSFMRFNTLIPLILIWLVSSGLSWRKVIKAGLLGPLFAIAILATSSAWLETRDLIRSGSLIGLPLSEQASIFFAAYLNHLNIPTPDSIMRTIMWRVDMTDILAAQVRHQPAFEPYAHGDTLLSGVYTVVPRALWPDKPTVAGGSAFVTQFSGLRYDEVTSVGLPYPFELYANGGPFLVVLGLGIIAYVCARLEYGLMRPQKSLGGFWALALITAVLTEGGQQTDVVLPALVASALAAYASGVVIETFCGDVFSSPASRKMRRLPTPRYGGPSSRSTVISLGKALRR